MSYELEAFGLCSVASLAVLSCSTLPTLRLIIKVSFFPIHIRPSALCETVASIYNAALPFILFLLAEFVFATAFLVKLFSKGLGSLKWSGLSGFYACFLVGRFVYFKRAGVSQKRKEFFYLSLRNGTTLEVPNIKIYISCFAPLPPTYSLFADYTNQIVIYATQ